MMFQCWEWTSELLIVFLLDAKAVSGVVEHLLWCSIYGASDDSVSTQAKTDSILIWLNTCVKTSIAGKALCLKICSDACRMGSAQRSRQGFSFWSPFSTAWKSLDLVQWTMKKCEQSWRTINRRIEILKYCQLFSPWVSKLLSSLSSGTKRHCLSRADEGNQCP